MRMLGATVICAPLLGRCPDEATTPGAPGSAHACFGCIFGITHRNWREHMTAVRLLGMLVFTGIAGCTSGPSLRTPGTFDTDQIRAAERRVTGALAAPDVTAWVYEYTEDAVLLEPAAPPVSGRVALLELARAMKPIASATISSDHIEGSGNVAYSYGTASWISGRPPDATSTSRVRQVLAWRREADGVWRIAMEAFLPLEAGK